MHAGGNDGVDNRADDHSSDNSADEYANDAIGETLPVDYKEDFWYNISLQ